jgi:hypothetical protein
MDLDNFSIFIYIIFECERRHRLIARVVLLISFSIQFCQCFALVDNKVLDDGLH